MKAAFYDFDGTLVSSNVVTRYFYFARRAPGRLDRVRRTAAVLLGLPYWVALDARSRAEFNRRFYRLYAGLRRDWLDEQARRLFEEEIRPKIYPGSMDLLRADRAEGFRLVLVTGGLDFVIAPAAAFFGFDDVIANRMSFENGLASGRLEEPLLAEEGKVRAIEAYRRRYNVKTSESKAYSDSFSDIPMLRCAGSPVAVNPDRRLRSAARERGWPILNTKS